MQLSKCADAKKVLVKNTGYVIVARCSNQEDTVILQQAQKDGTLLTDTDEAVVLRQVANLVATVLPLDRQDDLLQAIAKKCYQEEWLAGVLRVAADATCLELYSVGKQFGLVAKEFCRLGEESG